MSADEQGKVSGRAARKYTGSAFDGTPAGFMRAWISPEPNLADVRHNAVPP